jgi:hypothetical protein
VIRLFSDLDLSIQRSNPIGVFADTSVIFAATYPPDIFNADCEKAFETLAKFSTPTFASVNVRAEFLENHRRAYIADSLVDFLEDMASFLSGPLLLKLQSHKKTHRKNIDEGRSNKLNVDQIKIFRRELRQFTWMRQDGWKTLCQRYLKPQITSEWEKAEKHLSLNFISSRSNDLSPYLDKIPDWVRAVNFIGEYGISSADAMILNMFLCSKIPILLTADLEMADCVIQASDGTRQVFVPDSIQNN